MHPPSLVNSIPFPPRFFMKTMTSSCRPSRTSTHLLHWHCTALDNDNSSVLLLLDLSVAVDTVDHQILLSFLNSFWHSVYCTPMGSVISQTDISPLQSLTRQLMYGVPQGSVMGPVLFVLYTTPLSDIIASHSVQHQLFGDDTQLQKSAPLSKVTNLAKEPNDTDLETHAQIT